jgi:hypothetical protein
MTPAPDLELAIRGDLVPELRGRLRGVVAGDVQRELEAVGVEAVADEASHRDAAVLDLRVPEEADGLLVRRVPELGVRERQRVPEAHDGVELDGELLEVRLGLLDGHAGAGRLGRDERAGAGEGEGGDDLLHDCVSRPVCGGR